jgi:hypothetical protein
MTPTKIDQYVDSTMQVYVKEETDVVLNILTAIQLPATKWEKCVNSGNILPNVQMVMLVVLFIKTCKYVVSFIQNGKVIPRIFIYERKYNLNLHIFTHIYVPIICIILLWLPIHKF